MNTTLNLTLSIASDSSLLMTMFPLTPTISIKQIADCVLKLSDFYIQNPDSSTPWQQDYCQIAYRFYFLPLNFLRNQRVIQQANRLRYFEGLSYFIDWGCGPGTASLALREQPGLQIEKQVLIDQSSLVLQVFSDLHANLIQTEKTSDVSLRSYFDQKQRTCLVCSYSLTEVRELPIGWNQFEALMILEPSTSQDGRQLLELRQNLIAQGYSIWGPCIHQLACPLLTESKTDWCHDRVVVDAPEWFQELENSLPMKNRTITTSYLLARKKMAPSYSKNLGRLTGDSREEKGKTRQMFCRGDKREFLTWMHKQISPQVFPRGELVLLPKEYEIKSNEIRLLKESEWVVDPKPS